MREEKIKFLSVSLNYLHKIVPETPETLFLILCFWMDERKIKYRGNLKSIPLTVYPKSVASSAQVRAVHKPRTVSSRCRLRYKTSLEAWASVSARRLDPRNHHCCRPEMVE